MNDPRSRGPSYLIDLVSGDGIGPEVAHVAAFCVDLVAERFDFTVTWRELDWGSDHYRRTGSMLPPDGLEQLGDGDAILLGAVGDPDIDDTVTLWGLLIPIRRAFDQYVNLRPVRSLPGVPAAVRAGGDDVDLVIVRENVEGEYSSVGGRVYPGTEHELAVQETVFTRRGVARVARYASELARERGSRLVSATKSNGIVHTMPFWDEVVAEQAEEAGVAVEPVLVDALAARLVLRPRSLDVVVGSNLFGDILSDLAAAVTGSIGVAPSANLNPERTHPSMFEPVHGSAPDIAGQGVANPVAAVLSAALMLRHLGQHGAASDLEGAVDTVCAAGVTTADLGGRATTVEVRQALGRALAERPTARRADGR